MHTSGPYHLCDSILYWLTNALGWYPPQVVLTMWLGPTIQAFVLSECHMWLSQLPGMWLLHFFGMHVTLLDSQPCKQTNPDLLDYGLFCGWYLVWRQTSIRRSLPSMPLKAIRFWPLTISSLGVFWMFLMLPCTHGTRNSGSLLFWQRTGRLQLPDNARYKKHMNGSFTHKWIICTQFTKTQRDP